METHRNLTWEGLKMVVCGCWWSWNSNGTTAPEPEVRVPGSVFPVLLPAFPVVCSFRNLCSQLHYNFLAKKYKTQLNFNHVNSYEKLCPDVNRRSLQRDLKVLLEKTLIQEIGVGATDPTRHYALLPKL